MKTKQNSRWLVPSILLTITFFLSAGAAHAAPKVNEGGQDIGGGDSCENRIREIRDDISNWITLKGYLALELPSGITPEFYATEMADQIGKAKIKCASQGDEGYPVAVTDPRTSEVFAKTCKFERTEAESKITCDLIKFNSMKMDETGQYVLVHHEFAGLAKVERPDGAESHYDVSNQISSYLANTVVKKLVVRSKKTGCPSPKILPAARDASGEKLSIGFGEAARYCARRGGHLPTALEWAEYIYQLGGRGIVQTTKSRPNSLFQTVTAQNLDGSIDKFQFSGEGSPRDKESPEYYRAWSSSIVPYSSEILIPEFKGKFETEDRDDREVWCAEGPAPAGELDNNHAVEELGSLCDRGPQEVRVAANTGHTLRRDRSVPALGEAYLDTTTNLIWGDVVTGYEDGLRPLKLMAQHDAKAYCEQIGTRLPTYYEFEDLANSLGAAKDNYSPLSVDPNFDILPSMTDYRQFWTSTNSWWPDYSLYFESSYGGFDRENPYYGREVRCVATKR
jgi:hypothetical protein